MTLLYSNIDIWSFYFLIGIFVFIMFAGVIVLLSISGGNRSESTEVLTNERDKLRIIKIDGRYYPQKFLNNSWVNILCSNELGWYRAPSGFNGYFDLPNAEMTISNAKKYWHREATEYYNKN